VERTALRFRVPSGDALLNWVPEQLEPARRNRRLRMWKRCPEAITAVLAWTKLLNANFLHTLVGRER